MDIIDEDGHLFGLINIVDALVVLLVVAVLISGLVLIFDDTDDDTEIISVNITVERAPAYIAERIEIGNISKDVTITEKSVSSAEIVVRDSDGELHIREHPTDKTVNLQVKLHIKRSSRGVQFRGNPMRVGTEITIDDGKVKFTGKVTDY
jgi:hypothetical protein